jgi:polysaccharide export outer membrane protein
MNQLMTRHGRGACIGIAVVAAFLAAPLPAQEPDGPAGEPDRGVEIASVRVTDPSSQTPSSIVSDDGQEYRIGKQDLLEIRVFELEELSQTVRVGGDGRISLPLLGKVTVAGMTTSEMEEQLERLLDPRYVVDPHVTVFVKEYVSTKVAISGAVQTPGRFEMIGPMTLLDMVSQAGGLQDDHGEEIVIFRAQPDGSRLRVSVDLRRLVYDADPAQNVDLEPGDVIYVTTQERIRIFVGGAVNNPNMFEIPKSEPVTMMKAITLAGGTTPRAAEKKIQIIRTDPSGQRMSFVVNYRKVRRGKAEDPVLKPDDVVFVQQSFF